MANQTEAEVVRDLAKLAAAPAVLQLGQRYAFRQLDGTVEQVDLSDELPARKAGIVVVRDVASFAHYYGKHADEASEVFADIDKATITAVLDAHRSADDDFAARWQGHRLVLALQTTLPWRTWMEYDRQPMRQQGFAEFLEDNRRDLDPEGSIDAATFLELAQSFQAMTTAEFSGGTRLSSGEIELSFKETTAASAGKTKKIEIPTEFTLAIAPYDDCPSGLIGARFRYRAKDGGVTFMYVLDNPERHAQEAVEEIGARLSSAIGDKPIMLGTPTP